MSRTALVMFAVTSLVGCSNATDPVQVPPDNGARVEVGSAWSGSGEVSARGEYIAPQFEPSMANPVLVSSPLVVPEPVQGPYLYDESPAAIGLLDFVNTASAAELDRQIEASDEPLVGRIVDTRPFMSVAGLQDVPGVNHEVLDGLLQHALLTGYVDSFDHQEVILALADLAQGAGWDLNQSFGDQLRPMDDAEAERKLGALPQQMRARFRDAHEMDWVALAVSTHAIEAYGVSVGHVISVTTNDPSVERFGAHYFVDATDNASIVVEADFVAE